MKLLSLTSPVPLFVLSGFALAQPCEYDQALVDQMGEAVGREIVIDPRVCSFNGIPASEDIDYESLLVILKANNLVFETADLILIVPASLNSIPTRLLQENDPGVSDNEIVARVMEIPTEAAPSVTAPQLVPVLRPMMPIMAELTAIRDANTLIFVDRYDNIRRLTATAEELIESALSPTDNP
jgi:type II secretory pathway component GspD/PulD (secretin)